MLKELSLYSRMIIEKVRDFAGAELLNIVDHY
jgi:hypothetical protein